MTKEQFLKLLERKRNDNDFMTSFLCNLSHLSIVLRILVVEMHDINEDQIVEIDKKKMNVNAFMDCAENSSIAMNEYVSMEKISIPIDKDTLKNYEELIRRSLVWQ